MNMTRRGFLGSILAAGVAPVIVKASSLMKVPVRSPLLPFGMSGDGWTMGRHLVLEDAGWGNLVIYDWAGAPLATMTIPNIPAASLGEIDVPIKPALVNRTGRASHFSILDSHGVARIGGSIGEGSGGIVLSNNHLMTGQPLSIDIFKLTEGNSGHGLRYSNELRNARLDAVFK